MSDSLNHTTAEIEKRYLSRESLDSSVTAETNGALAKQEILNNLDNTSFAVEATENKCILTDFLEVTEPDKNPQAFPTNNAKLESVTGEPVDVTAEITSLTVEPANVTGEPVNVTAEIASLMAEPTNVTDEIASRTAEIASRTAEIASRTAEIASLMAEPMNVTAEAVTVVAGEPANVITESTNVTTEPEAVAAWLDNILKKPESSGESSCEPENVLLSKPENVSGEKENILSETENILEVNAPDASVDYKINKGKGVHRRDSESENQLFVCAPRIKKQRKESLSNDGNALEPTTVNDTVRRPRRSCRERKAVMRSEFVLDQLNEDDSLYEDNQDQVHFEETTQSNGGGEALGLISNFVNNYESLRGNSPVIRKLYTVLFGTYKLSHNKEEALFNWSGVSTEESSTRLYSILSRSCSVNDLREMGKKLFGLSSGSDGLDTKQAWVDMIFTILSRPSSSLVSSSSSETKVASSRVHSITGYQLFCSKARPQLSQEHPLASNKDLIKMLSSKWRMLSEKEKEEFQLSSRDKNSINVLNKQLREDTDKTQEDSSLDNSDFLTQQATTNSLMSNSQNMNNLLPATNSV